MRVLITCFLPFRRRPKNGSQALARYLKAHMPETDLSVVEMPVRWGAVEAVAGPVIDEWSPDLLLGIGEGGPDAVVIETVGHNVRRGEDVDGAPPPTDAVLESGALERRSRISFAWNSSTVLSVPIQLGLDAGTYLCNNALYVYCGTKVQRAGFVHVPPQGDAQEAPYCERLGPILLDLVRQNSAR